MTYDVPRNPMVTTDVILITPGKDEADEWKDLKKEEVGVMAAKA